MTCQKCKVVCGVCKHFLSENDPVKESEKPYGYCYFPLPICVREYKGQVMLEEDKDAEVCSRFKRKKVKK